MRILSKTVVPHLCCLVRLPLLQFLPDAGDDGQTGLQRETDLLPDHLVRLAEHVTPLAVTEDDPASPAVLDHARG